MTPPGHTSFHLLTHRTAKLEAVKNLMEKLSADLEKQDLTTERELSYAFCLHKKYGP